MLSVIIKDDGEPNVIKLTYENLYRELKDIPGAELLVAENWFSNLPRIKNDYVCFVEADCLVNSGYFSSQMGLFQKNPMLRKLAMLSSAVGVNAWHNKFYGYSLGNEFIEGIIPIHAKKSKAVYPVQVGYAPGAIIRASMLRNLLEQYKPAPSWQDDLIYFSTQLSLGFWRQGDGNRVHINPNTTYVTTEDYVNDLARFSTFAEDLAPMFKKETIT